MQYDGYNITLDKDATPYHNPLFYILSREATDMQTGEQLSQAYLGKGLWMTGNPADTKTRHYASRESATRVGDKLHFEHFREHIGEYYDRSGYSVHYRPVPVYLAD